MYLSLSLELDSPRVKSPNNVYLFWLLTTFVLSFVLSSNNKNSFAGLHASRKCQLCTDHSGGKIQMTKFKIVKQHICLAMKMLPIFFWLYPTFRYEWGHLKMFVWFISIKIYYFSIMNPRQLLICVSNRVQCMN